MSDGTKPFCSLQLTRQQADNIRSRFQLTAMATDIERIRQGMGGQDPGDSFFAVYPELLSALKELPDLEPWRRVDRQFYPFLLDAARRAGAAVTRQHYAELGILGLYHLLPPENRDE